MRGIQLSLNQTQKLRLQRALEQLESLSPKANLNASVTIADTITINYEDGVLKGYGTFELDGEVVATVCGVVERVNKLVYVRALRARYKPEIGDIIVGRVIEVAPKRWRLEINFSQDAVLMLSSMSLPDGIQRRQTAVDELNMLSIFEENDVVCLHVGLYHQGFKINSQFIHTVCGLGAEGLVKYVEGAQIIMMIIRFSSCVFFPHQAEVRGFQHDSSLHLQARSQKYGKLEKGQLLTVPPYLVKRRKQHFHHLEQYGIDLILGCNGFIWVGEHVEAKDDMVEDQVNKSEQQNVKSRSSVSLEELEKTYTPVETRQNRCRTTNAVRVLSTLGFNFTVEVIMETVNLSISLNLNIHEMLGAEFCVLVVEREAERRSLTKKKG